MEVNTQSKRGRNWATIVYPDSAPENWLDLLDDLHVPAFVSPLHDRDVNPGELPGDPDRPKKPHYHVLVTFDGNKSREQMQQLFSVIGGVGVELVQSLRAMARYLCHLDNPDKAQYSPSLVHSFGGLNYEEVIHSIADHNAALLDMREFVRENQVFYMADFVDYCDAERPEWAYLINTRFYYIMNAYIKSNNYRFSKSCDPE